jgi:2-polyprenyl-3-methyl-5-hydroxy-6-metoxy-1,4-benzoquinol methylase
VSTISAIVDEKYYQNVKPKGIAERLLIKARDSIYQDLLRTMYPKQEDTILDVGVSDVINDGANLLERAYPHKNNITACGLSDALEFRETFPECSYVKLVPNEELPFTENYFDIATSNAVVEHVGSFENQVFFIKELCRVAKRVFISVPNRYFPVEHHTALPLLHFEKNLFSLACAITNKSEWADEKNLILMTRKRLWQLAAMVDKRASVGYTGLHIGLFSSNIYIALH